MKYGYTIIYVSKEPEEKPWGQVVGYVRALDGSIIELCSPIGG